MLLAAAEVGIQELQYVLNTLSFLVWGALVMWVCAGFTMLESGTVRTKNSSMICLKDVGIFAIAGLSYFVVGYKLMYVDVDGFIGTLQLLREPLEAGAAVLDGASDRLDEILSLRNTTMLERLFQMLFVATTASIVSGAILERVKLWVFWAFALALSAVINPVAGSWVWGGGWLQDMGFLDLAGGTAVHTGGSTRRRDRRRSAEGQVPRRRDGQGHSSFECACGDARRADPVARLVRVQRRLAGIAGHRAGRIGDERHSGQHQLGCCRRTAAAVLCSRPVFGRLGLAPSLNGALAGPVAITAGPVFVEHWWAGFSGAIGGVLATLATRLLERMRLDDVVGAIPVHFVAGIWGTLAAAIAAGADFGTQLIGVAGVVGFSFVASLAVW